MALYDEFTTPSKVNAQIDAKLTGQRDEQGGIAGNDTTTLNIDSLSDFTTLSRKGRTSFYVKDIETGGLFTYKPASDSLTPDGENIFAVSGGGYAVRNYQGTINRVLPAFDLDNARVMTSTAPDTKIIKSNVLNPFTGNYVIYKEIDFVPDLVDGIVFNQSDGKYFKMYYEGYLPAKSIGMVENNSSKAESNYQILLNYIKNGFNILIDDTYYLQSNYGAVNDNIVNHTINISGIDRDKSKLILNGGTYFNPKTDVVFQKLTVESPTTISQLTSFNDQFESNFKFIDCSASGKLRVLTANIPNTYDFETTFSGFRSITITNNSFKNIHYTSGIRTTFLLNDIPVNLTRIEDNNVENFSYIFFYMGISNGHPSTEYIWKNRSRIIIKRNNVLCNDDYDPKVIHPGISFLYYCFTLIEGYEVVCTDNIFDGFHISDAPDTNVYDNYLSCVKLTYDRNEYKNLVNFTPGLFNLDLMKSKMSPTGASIDDLDLERFYRGNKYRMDKEYALKFGEDPFLLRKKMNGFQGPMDNVVISDNQFDMYILSFPYYGMRYPRNYSFINNNILTETAEQGIERQSFVWIPSTESGEYRNTFYNIVFSKNIIKVKLQPLPEYISTQRNYLIWNDANSSDTVNIVFEDNNIDMYGLTNPIYDSRTAPSDGRNWKKVVFRRNAINAFNVKNTLSIMVHSIDNYESWSEGNNLIINMSDSIQASVIGTLSTANILPITLGKRFNFKYIGANQHIFLCRLFNLIPQARKIKVNVEVSNGLVNEQFDSEFEIIPDSAFNIIRTVGKNIGESETEFTQQDYLLDGSGSLYNNFLIQKNNQTGTDIISFNISNSSSTKNAYLTINTSHKTSEMDFRVTITIG